MKLFTNKYPIAVLLTIDGEGLVDMERTSVSLSEGKIFKVCAVSCGDVILECEGKSYFFSAQMFSIAFEETEVKF